MEGITFTPLPNNTIQVRNEGKITGTIKPVDDGFAYFPINSKLKGETMPTVNAVKKSLIED